MAFILTVNSEANIFNLLKNNDIMTVNHNRSYLTDRS